MAAHAVSQGGPHVGALLDAQAEVTSSLDALNAGGLTGAARLSVPACQACQQKGMLLGCMRCTLPHTLRPTLGGAERITFLLSLTGHAALESLTGLPLQRFPLSSTAALPRIQAKLTSLQAKMATIAKRMERIEVSTRLIMEPQPLLLHGSILQTCRFTVRCSIQDQTVACEIGCCCCASPTFCCAERQASHEEAVARAQEQLGKQRDA